MVFSTVIAMWEHELGRAAAAVQPTSSASEPAPEKSLPWYASANDFWEAEENCALDDDGVLGGFGHVSPADIFGSKQFLKQVERLRPGFKRDVAVGKPVCPFFTLVFLPFYTFSST